MPGQPGDVIAAFLKILCVSPCALRSCWSSSPRSQAGPWQHPLPHHPHAHRQQVSVCTRFYCALCLFVIGTQYSVLWVFPLRRVHHTPNELSRCRTQHQSTTRPSCDANFLRICLFAAPSTAHASTTRPVSAAAAGRSTSLPPDHLVMLTLLHIMTPLCSSVNSTCLHHAPNECGCCRT